MSVAHRREDGAGTVLAVAMLGVVVTVTLATSGVVGVVAAHRRVQSAADLAALAGASALQGGGGACAQAGAIAERNGAELRICQVDDWNVSVLVVSRMRLPGGTLDLEARGRAGPVTAAVPPRCCTRVAPRGRGRVPPPGQS